MSILGCGYAGNIINTSVMIIIAGASLSEQHTDLLICHCTSRICYTQVDIYISHKPTARTATVSVATYARTKLYTKVISCVIRAVYASCAWPLPEATSTTVVIEFVLPVGNLPSGVSCHVYFNFSHLNSR